MSLCKKCKESLLNASSGKGKHIILCDKCTVQDLIPGKNIESQERLRKLQIAKLVYDDIQAVIQKYEKTQFIHAHWDECVTVEDALFHGHELMKEIQ